LDLDICRHDFGYRTPEFYCRTELCRVKRRGLGSRKVAVEAPDAPRAFKKTQRGQSTTCSADYESGDQRVGGSGILLHQAFQCHRELVDRVRRGEVQGLGKGLIGDRSRLPDNLAEMSSDAERQDVDRARGGSNIKTNVSQRYTPNFAPTCNVSSKQSNSTGELASRPSAKVRKGPLYASRVATWEQLKTLSLNGHWSQHVVGVEFDRAAPERGLEDVTQWLADAVFTSLHQQSRPFQRSKHAR